MTNINNLERFRDYILKHYPNKRNDVTEITSYEDIYGITRGRFEFRVPRIMIPGLTGKAYEMRVESNIKTYHEDSVTLAFGV